MQAFNLLPWRAWQRQKLYRDIFLYGLLPLLLIAIGTSFFAQHERIQLKDLLQHKKALLTKLKGIQQQKQLISHLQKLKNQQQDLLELMAHTGGLLPDGLAINEWRYQGQVMSWKGEAWHAGLIAVFAKRLSGVPQLKKVQIQQIQAFSKNLTQSFSIQADYVGKL
ncbi:MAG: hypothetical protein K0S29_873 [Gammaproteobacteria bacterium]|jgi:Tfp pilus assembly protein PilN|nr:hypothetical protein [Gammaproteobacteria bacterium]